MNSDICIILTNPQMGENIGAAARAMANFGFSDLRLVNPRDGWPNPKADSLAAGAFSAIPMPTLYESLSDSLHDCHCSYATTARRRHLMKPVMSPQQAAGEALRHVASGKKVALVFGAEQSGMSNEDLSLCSAVVNIPTNPEFSSLNLGQAVLLMVAQIGLQGVSDAPPAPPHSRKISPPATGQELDDFLQRLKEELEHADFFKAQDLKPTMVRNIRNIFTRGGLTQQEVKTLHGIVSALIHKQP